MSTTALAPEPIEVATERGRAPSVGHSPARAWVLCGLAGLVFAAAYGPLLVEFGINLWNKPHYQHFPFILAACAGLFAYRLHGAASRPEALPAGAWGQLLEGSLLLASWGLLAIAYVAFSPVLAAVSAILLLGVLALRLNRRVRVENLAGVWLLLWLVIPPPVGRDQMLIAFLQRLSSRVSSAVLDTLGVRHLMEGNTLLLPDHELFIDEACSGIVSVTSVVACAAIYGVWQKRSLAHVLLLGLAGVGWATLLNVVRISTIACALVWYGVDWSEGVPHEVLGGTLMLLTFGALMSTDQLLLGLLAPIGIRWEELTGSPLRFGHRLATGWEWLSGATQPGSESATRPAYPGPRAAPLGLLRKIVGPGLIASFALLATVQLAIGQWAVGDFWAAPAALAQTPSLDRAMALAPESLPADLAGLTQSDSWREERNAGNVFGNFSQVYRYATPGGGELLLSCDFPFTGGVHELTVCYQGQGWELIERRRIEPTGSEADAWPYVHAAFRRPDGQAAEVFYCAFDEHAQPIRPNADDFAGSVLDAFGRRKVEDATNRVFQVQVLAVASGALADAQRDQARELFTQARGRLLKQVTAGPVPATAPGPIATPAMEEPQ